MALNFAQGFEMAHNEPVDNRLVLSKAEMVAMKKAKMPTVYLAVCSDDGQLYIYNSANIADPETGRFRVISADADIDIEAITNEQIKTLFQKEENEDGI